MRKMYWKIKNAIKYCKDLAHAMGLLKKYTPEMIDLAVKVIDKLTATQLSGIFVGTYHVGRNPGKRKG